MQIMGLFSKFKKEKTAVDWSNAYTATPKFYAKPDGSPFGAIALTEGTETILPKMPQNEYAVDGKRVADWKMVLVSTTKDGIIGDCDYQKALKKLEKHTLDSNENTILIKGLSLGYANNEAGPCMGLRIQTQTIFGDENSSAFIFISFS